MNEYIRASIVVCQVKLAEIQPCHMHCLESSLCKFILQIHKGDLHPQEPQETSW